MLLSTLVRTKGLAFAAVFGIAVVAGSVAAASQRAHACATERDTRVEGVVIDREGHGVAGALVVARKAGVSTIGDPLAMGVTTDGDGRFRIVGLPPGEYAFVALRAGAIGGTPEMPVIDHLVVTISLAGATRT